MQCSSMTSVSVPASRFLSEFLSWLPFMVDIYLQLKRNVCFSEVSILSQQVECMQRHLIRQQGTRVHWSVFPIGELFSDRMWFIEN